MSSACQPSGPCPLAILLGVLNLLDWQRDKVAKEHTDVEARRRQPDFEAL